MLSSAAAWAQPTVTGFSPTSGASGSTVTITGTGFTGATSVRFGELSAVFTVNSNTQITATVPRAASTMPINVTTSAGPGFSASDFTVMRGSSVTYSLVTSGFAGVTVGTNAAPAVADLDANGRLDVLVGVGDGTIARYEQNTVNGTTFSALGSLRTSSNAVIDMGTEATVAIVDLEGNGLYNLVLGRGDGTVSEYEQTSAGAGTFDLVQNNLSNISTLNNTVTSMTDLDGDGYLELLVGKGDGIISHSEQNAFNTDDFIRLNTNFNNLQLSGNAAPFCVDLDGNGRIDILVGLNTGALYRYEQASAGSIVVNQLTTNFNSISAGSNAKPCVTDIDGDGLLDLLVGRGDGTISRYEQGGTVPAPTITGFTPTSGPVGTAVTVTGTNLAGVSAVTVNGTQGTLTGTPTATGFTFTVGSGSSSGTISATTPGGSASSSGSFTVTVPNTAPTDISLSNASVAENQPVNTLVGTFSTTDAQGGTFSYTFAAGGADNGWFNMQSSGTLTTNGSFDFETKSSYSIKIRSTDAGGLFFEKTFTIAVSDVNETPTVTSFTPASGPVGTSGIVITGTNFTSAGTVTVRFNGTTATTVTVNSNTQLTATVPTGATTGTISVQNSDGTGSSSSNFTVTTVTDLSVSLTDSPDPVNEGSTLTYAIGVSNAGPSTASSLTVTLSLPAGAVFISATGTGWTCSQSGGTVTATRASLSVGAAPAITVAITAPGQGGTISATATVSSSTTDNSAGNNSASATTTVTPVNDAPVVATSGGSTAWTQGGGAVAVDAALTVSDIDNATLASATVRLTTNFQSAQDVLAFINTSSATFGNISATYTAGTGTLALTSAGPTATVAQWQAALRAITYNNTAGSPTAGTRTVSFVASDGTTASAAATKNVTLTLRTAAPRVDTPADAASTNDTTPTYSGTAANGSTVTVYVDGVSIGTVTANAGNGNWSKTQPTALSEGSHTVYATAQDSGQPVSLNSSTNTFTVDTTAPTVTISSAAGPSGSSTGTTPVPFTVTFSEDVANFAIGDITVSGGTKSALTTVTDRQYTFTVTPSGSPVTITVNIAAGRAQDAVGNDNAAATPFSITYAVPPTITALSASAELPGMPVVITGTGFTSGSTVSFGGVAAASVTFTSATSLTATVPAGAALGSSPVVVTTSGVSSGSAPAFAVLKVYDAVASCLSTTNYTATGDGAWHYLLASNGQVVAAIQDTRAALGTVRVDFLITGSASAVRQDGRAHKYLDRNWHLTATNGTFAGSSVNVRFYGLTSEFARLQAADASVSYASLKSTQYSGPNEDCQLSNNAATAEARTLAVSASTPGNGVAWFVAQVSVPDHFSEFYLTGSATPLPVELLAFTAAAQGNAVALAWRTASEKSSARFEVERSTDGRAFARIGERAAQGTTTSPTDYAFLDNQAPGSPSAQAPIYYRLRQVDLDGTATYSPVRVVTAGGKVDLALYPNPAREAVAVTGLPAGAAVTVLDALGRTVAAATAEADGTARLTLPTGLAAGVYAVRSGRLTRRLVVE
ncbi:hypothetical protein GCM10027345_44460 [Hymenobacter daeguensis]